MNEIKWIVAPWRVLWLILSMFLMLLVGPLQAQTFLPPEKAFQARVSQSGPHALQVDFTLARGVYLYRERLEARLDAGSGASPILLKWDLPPGQSKHDPTFDKVLEVYHGDVSGTVSVPDSLHGEHELTVVYQGCADAGLCYPPQKKRVLLKLNDQGQIQAVGSTSAASASVSAAVSDNTEPAAEDDGGISRALASGQWWTVVPVFLLAGVLLSLTPCVLPMVPILSSIIVGQKEHVSRARGFALALSYSQGMALVYTALGVAAGLLGQGLAAYLQHPWVVLVFAALMVLLALSMFGLYELQLPASVQSWLGAGSSHLPGGKFISVFAMGVVSALVVSPCVSAPLAGALLYISQTHDVVLGGAALYAMAWGMSVPLLLVGLSAGSLLPRTGPWMKAVKALFGVLMLGMAVWVARPAWPYLQSLVGATPAASAHHSALPFERVRTVAELDAALALAKAQGKPVMLDFYADWCTSCLEMERETFSDPQVQAHLKGAVVLQADVTVNTADDRALLQRFKLFGPPGIIFFDAQGQERTAAQVVGFQKPQDFLRSLQQAGF
ncbi:protein-disulfide reductase DsbD [Aquabacterium sp.]|uniref:protein-disulfide reductase DsbD n=1 Tax=Aquabacterium sp. TaxID=1872578 RepID=UPI0025C2BFD3|nr:protein-disulfide reductase DsbD [Aquabacterium sp.]